MTYYEQYIREFADPRQTSYEIALAIFETAAYGDEERMWEAPTDSELASVMALAWEYADPDEDTLHWGIEIIRREVPSRCTCRWESVNSASIDPPMQILDKWCPEHGLDPDAENDRRRDDAMWDKEQSP